VHNQTQHIIEIGPGEGALSEHLLNLGKSCKLIEIDRRAIDFILNRFPQKDFPNYEILQNDILEFDFSDYTDKSLQVIGNIPYYISTPILFKLFENSNKIHKVVLTMQKELAERLTAKIRTKAYRILTVASQLIGTAKNEFDIPPHCFKPQPKVWSSVVSYDFTTGNYELFTKLMPLVRAAFSQRRKVILNAISGYLMQRGIHNKNELLNFAVERNVNYLKKRAEELVSSDFEKLYELIESYKKEI